MTPGVHLPPDLRLKVEREMGRRSLAWFVRHAWPIVEKTEYKHNWHIDHICAHLEAVTRGEIRKLLINIPPGGMKSLLVSVFWPAWEWIQNPTIARLATSFDGQLTMRDAGKVKDIVASTWFVERWGHRTRLDPNEGVGEFRTYTPQGTDLGGWLFSTSFGGKTTGRHPDRKTIDDPTKPQEATKENLYASHKWWQDTMRSRARDQSTVATVCIMQRLDEDDLAGYFLSREEGWVHVRIPLEFDGEPYATRWGTDPRTTIGESFWHGRFPQSVIDEIKRDTPDVGIYSSQYQQNPTPASGIVFKSTHFVKRWRTLPESGLWIQSWDFTFKGESDSDWVVGGVWCSVGARKLLIDVWRRQATFTQSVQAIRDVSAMYPQALTKLIEDKANGPAIINYLTEEGKIPGIVPIKLGADSKLSRARAVVPYFEGSNVEIPEAAPWVLDFIAEMLKFPRGKKDDQVDMTSQALNWYTANGGMDYASAMAAHAQDRGGHL